MQQGCALHVDVMMLGNPLSQMGSAFLLCMMVIPYNLTGQRIKDSVCCAGWAVHRC